MGEIWPLSLFVNKATPIGLRVFFGGFRPAVTELSGWPTNPRA